MHGWEEENSDGLSRESGEAPNCMKTEAEGGRRREILRFCAIWFGFAVASSASGVALGQAKSSTDRECRNHASVQLMSSVPSSDLPVIERVYLPALVSKTKEKWFALIPLEARPPQKKRGCVLVDFAVHPDGKVTDMTLAIQSGDIALDRAAWAAITSAAPYAPFPNGVRTTMIRMRMAFLYNEKAGRKEQ